MEDLILIKPKTEYANQIAKYKQEFIDAGSSMDGTGMAEKHPHLRSI